MSASPSGPPSNGRTPTPNSGGQPQFIRRPRPADPLRQGKRPTPVRKPPIAKTTGPRPAGLTATGRPGGLQALNGVGVVRAPVLGSALPNGVQPPRPQPQLDFSEVPTGPYQDYPLFTTKRALREGLRYHIARFQGKKDVDPTNQNDFVRPVSLHRRDPRQPPPGKALKDEDTVMTGQPIDDKERERLEIAKAERDAQRAADLAQIAPTGNNAAALAAKKNAPPKNQKTNQVWRVDKTEEEKKESDLRYEENLPWHLEDADNKHTFVGNYEAALSDTNVILIIDGGTFKMVPLEKWYKFTPKNQFKTMTIEEAENAMNKKNKASRWVMHAEKQREADDERMATRRGIGNLYMVKGESNTSKNTAKSELQDADDIDFEGDLFADDDEQAAVEPDNDEETKYATEKIKREQLGANLFGEADEEEVEKEIKQEADAKDMNKKLGKGTKKALKKRERNYLYDSDSSNPYSSSSDEDLSDDEKQKEADRKKDEEAKLLKAKNASALPSGASSKGSNTPSGRPKHSDPNKKHNHLKRPGSPNLSASETSGNESTRKKHKKKHHVSSSQPTGSSTPIPSRGMSTTPSSSQPPPGRKSSIVKLNVVGSKLSEIQSATPNPTGAMSDAEATGGEMSDGAGGKKKKKIKLRLGGASANVSRAGSPMISRAGSPAVQAGTQLQNGSTPATQTSEAKPVTAEEIASALPPEGIAIGAMLKLFAGRIKDKPDKEKFIKLVKDNSTFSPEDKLLRPKA